MGWRTCPYCGTEVTGVGIDDDRRPCFRCWELFEEEGGPQYDPEDHPRASAYGKPRGDY